MKKYGKEASVAVSGFALAVTLVGPLTASAAVFSSIDSVIAFACGISNWLFYGALVFGVIYILLGAFKYIQSGGNPENVASAQKTILYAVIGLFVAMIAGGIPQLMGSLLGAGVSSACQ